jgi:hypothetical protein
MLPVPLLANCAFVRVDDGLPHTIDEDKPADPFGNRPIVLYSSLDYAQKAILFS